jgi:hypothetical protein
VRVGLINTLSFERYGALWVDLLGALGAEVVLPDAEAVLKAGQVVSRDEGLLPLLARSSLRALRDVDLVLAPQLLTTRSEGPGAGQDPWVVDLPTMLARSEPGAPPIAAVPAQTGPSVEPMAMALLTRVQRDAGRVRRAWEQHRVSALRPARRKSAPANRAGTRRVALAGAPWWCAPGIAAALQGEAEDLSGQPRADPAELRAEGWRWRADLVDSDAEALGAVRRFARRGDVDVVRLLIDPASSADAWLGRRAAELAGQRLETLAVPAALEFEALLRAVLPPDRGATAR